MAIKISGTILIGVIWFAFIIIYLAFFADNFNLWQKAAVFLAPGVISFGIICVMWTTWALSKREQV